MDYVLRYECGGDVAIELTLNVDMEGYNPTVAADLITKVNAGLADAWSQLIALDKAEAGDEQV